MWHPDWLEIVSQATYEALRDHYWPELPPIDFGEHLVPILFEIGPGMPVGMGNGPLTFGEIDAWCRGMGIDLQPWERRWLRRLSIEYLNEGPKASKQFAPAPWTPDTKE